MMAESPHKVPARGVPAWTMALLLFGSGLCALIYQTAWLRLLRLVFGASTAASAVVLAIFMGGLGLGGLILGKRGEAKANPLGFYSQLELLIALSAGLTPWLIGGVAAAYVKLGGTAVLGELSGTLLRLVGATVVLGVPTFLMGGTLPAAARAAERQSDSGRRTVGLLYGINTLGAVLGAVLTTFLLLEFLGTRKALWVAALVNLLIAFVARSIARRLEDEPVAAAAAQPADAAGSTLAQNANSPAPLWLVLTAAAVVGFAFLTLELVWYRMLAPILGGTTYTFGVILAVALLGIGIGGWVYSLGAGSRRPTLQQFALTCSLEALLVVLPLALGDRVALFALALRQMAVVSFGALAGGWTLIAALVVLPPALVAGYQFPLLVALLGAGRQKVARQVGLTYAWNTAGAIVGAIAGGFVLIPWLSAPGTWRLATLLLVLLSGLCLLRVRRWHRLLLPGLCGATALVLCLAPGPTSIWRHGGIGAGRMELSFDGPNDLRNRLESQRRSLVWEIEGRESSIALIKSDGYAFIVNGKSDGSAHGDAPTMVMSGLVGAALHPNPRTSLVIGLGTGASAGWLAEVPTMERVDVVELEPAVLRVAEDCAAVNNNVVHHPKTRMLLGDGREYLLTTDQHYDLILSQPSNPYRAGISSLFTQDFYRAVTERLNPGGIFIQWLQGYEIDAQVVRTAYATLGSVFPVIETWQVGRVDLLLLASQTPFPPNPPQLAQRLAAEPFRSALNNVWGVHGVPGLYSGYLASPGLARAMGQQPGLSLNTDDRPVIEFGFIRNLGRFGLFSVQDLQALSHRLGFDRTPIPIDPLLLDELRSARYVAFDAPAPPPQRTLEPEQGRRFEARLEYTRGDLADAARLWLSQSAEPFVRADLTLLAESLAELGDDRTPLYAERLRSIQPAEAEAVLGRWHLRNGRPQEAADHLIRAFEGYRDNPWSSFGLMQRSTLLAQECGRLDPIQGRRLFDALDTPFAIRLIEDLRLSTRMELAFTVDFKGLCEPAFLAAEPHGSWTERYLALRWSCYRLTDNPLAEAAHEDLLAFYEQSPPPLWIEPANGRQTPEAGQEQDRGRTAPLTAAPPDGASAP